jgi:uncharacterized cofD-like protein
MYQLTGGDFEQAVKETSKVLAIRGSVVPSTVHNIHLIADYADGTRTEREADIPNPHSRIRRLSITPDDALPTKDALEAIHEADVIILGPGSLYTSVIPNLVINGMSEAIAQSGAFKIYVCNVMTQPGETDQYTASEHVQAIIDHSNKDVIDACLINNSVASPEALLRYEQENSYPVEADADVIRSMGYRLFATDLLSVTDFVRHDATKLNKALIKLIETYRVIKR